MHSWRTRHDDCWGRGLSKGLIGRHIRGTNRTVDCWSQLQRSEMVIESLKSAKFSCKWFAIENFNRSSSLSLSRHYGSRQSQLTNFAPVDCVNTRIRGKCCCPDSNRHQNHGPCDSQKLYQVITRTEGRARESMTSPPPQELSEEALSRSPRQTSDDREMETEYQTRDMSQVPRRVHTPKGTNRRAFGTIGINRNTDMRAQGTNRKKPGERAAEQEKRAMDPILEFPVGQDDPIEIIPINCAQLILFDMIDKARANSMRLVRKLSRHEVLNVGRPGNKVAVQLQSELLTKAPLHPIQTSVASSSKGDPPSLKAKRTSKSKPEKANLPGNVYAHMAQPCQLCGCKRVRVVNTGRLDGRNIMECTNRDCLATIKFTLVPAGTLINPGGTPEEFSWYDLDPEDIFYPSALTLKRIEESILSSPRQPFIPKMRYDEQGSIVVRCPGQKELVKLL